MLFQVEVTSENGCMFVVPRERDSLFMDDGHRLHRAPNLMPDFPHAHVRPLVADAGTVLAWHHNTIHWGSSCSPYAAEPRKSLAMSFRLCEEGRPWSEKDEESYWRRPFTRAEVAAGVDMQTRLRMCAGALVTYSVWHPEFKGFDQAHLGVEL
jgi:ectoine hydroxylase-related dioxygenase (phytanoyl-CoA dioxygenase family)